LPNRMGSIVALVVVFAIAAFSAGLLVLTGHASGDDPSCRVETEPRVGNIVPVIATCDWPIDADRIDALLTQWDRQEEYFGNLAESRVLSRSGNHLEVLQVHTARGMADREVVVAWEVTTIPHGTRYTWAKDADQSGTSGLRPNVDVHRGKWEVTELGAGKCRVVYEASYLPGGYVPASLVRMFQKSGVRRVMADLRSAVEPPS
jgi:hypothetical protein